MEKVAWLAKDGSVRTGEISNRGFFNVDRGEEYEIVPDANPAAVVFVKIDKVIYDA